MKKIPKITIKKDNEKNNHKVEIKSILKKIISKIKKFYSNKTNIFITIAIVLIIIIAIILSIIFHKKDERFALNEMYDVYPAEVRKIYSNIVESNCNGDLHLDIKIDSNKVYLNNLNKQNILDYLFSNIEKNEGLTDKVETSLIKKKQKELFNLKSDLSELIKDYQYKDYIYNVNGANITRKKNKCDSDIKYISFLYGYSWNKEQLSMDVNISYLKNGILYDLADNKLGSYDGDTSKLFELTKKTSYYRFYYIKDSENFKLDSVEWMNRS